MKKPLLVALALCLGVATAFAAGYGIEEKVALEKSITDKVQQIAVPYLGTSEFLIWTDVQVEFPETINTNEEKVKTGKDADPAWKEPDIPVLDNAMPGIEGEFLPDELQAKMPESLKAQLAGRPILKNLTTTMKLPVASIKSVSIRIVVPSTPANQEAMKARIATLQEFLEAVVPIASARGDKLTIDTMAYNRDPVERFVYYKDRLGTTVMVAFAMMMATIFVFGPVRSFMNRLAGTMENFEIKTTSSVKELIEQKESASKAQGMLPGGGVGGMGPAGLLTGPGGKPDDSIPFSFINANNMTKVLWTLESADAPTISVVAAHLAPDLSSQLIAALEPDKQKEVLLQLSAPQSVDKEIITQLHQQLKQQVESVVGGVDHILNILDQQPPEKQQALLEELRNDKPDVVEKIQNRLLTLDKVFKLPKAQLQNVLYEGYKQRITLGIILKTLPKDQQTAGLGALPESLTRVVGDEMNLPSTQGQVDTERRKFMALVRNLEKAGKITFQKATAA